MAKKNDRVRWIVVTVVAILLAVGLTSVITDTFTNWDPYDLFGNNTQVEQAEEA